MYRNNTFLFYPWFLAGLQTVFLFLLGFLTAKVWEGSVAKQLVSLQVYDFRSVTFHPDFKRDLQKMKVVNGELHSVFHTIRSLGSLIRN